MICVSTRGRAPAVPFRDAVLAGLAPDGGLYVPASLAPRPSAWWNDLRGASFQDVAVTLARELLGDEFTPAALTSLITEALNFPIPLVTLEDRLVVVELFHGPTLAFKDVGARTLARVIGEMRDTAAEPLTVLVATSGDTGSAVADAFFGVPKTRVVVLYPAGQISDVQEAQMSTLGGNVTAVAVAGTFDDCQRLAKEAFGSETLRDRLHLTSANSISLGRLIPQMFYYAYAALQAPVGAPVVISVPSGNFGNLAAGVMAQRLGAPITSFGAATTVNDTVPRYLESGRFEPRPSIATLANAMDVGNPSNFERLDWLFDGSREAMRSVISPSVHTDADVRRALAELHRLYGYIADPHTAIAYLGARTSWHFGTPWHPGTMTPWHFVLGTAHPAKFREAVEPAIGVSVQLPASLVAALGRSRVIERISPTLDDLMMLL